MNWFKWLKNYNCLSIYLLPWIRRTQLNRSSWQLAVYNIYLSNGTEIALKYLQKCITGNTASILSDLFIIIYNLIWNRSHFIFICTKPALWSLWLKNFNPELKYVLIISVFLIEFVFFLHSFSAIGQYSSTVI